MWGTSGHCLTLSKYQAVAARRVITHEALDTLPPGRTLVHLRSMLVAFLRGRGLAVNDLGTHTTDPVDYPDVAASGQNPLSHYLAVGRLEGRTARLDG